jgi:membrane-associated phospholipid phosphatase
LNKLTFGGDLFFSGHTGLPFLMALIFWNHPRLRYTFIAASLIFGTSAILGHYHYSIDVFAAYFITYSIFHIARTMFRSDLRLFESTSGVQVCGVKE